ncbi:glycosyltransferase [Paracoccus albus]|uniref:glycosyltransferase n=1 Tax=Paracoccus albus TaxID=3017784 RepID=UPI0022EFE447|nr:glycosyltransferase [Paracoccus albus]WBU61901.1 glycosyltransferase [Paracoccus albus]
MVLHRNDVPKDADLPRAQFRDARHRAQQQERILQEIENALCSGMGSAAGAIALRDQGYSPDIIISHCGWGTGLFLKEVWPEAVYIAYHEWYYNLDALSPADQIQPLTRDQILQSGHNMARNMPIVSEFVHADACWSPNRFQAGQFPRHLREKIVITHDGVDTSLNKPIPNAKINFPWLDLSSSDKIVTYIGRGFEPTRGFPTFMEAVKKVQEKSADAQVVIVGSNRVAYGEALSQGDSWLHRMLDDLDIDLSRVHITGTIELPDLRKVLAASSAHVYLTVPFVLSWSMMEAMAIGCPVIANDLPATSDIITNGENGFLVTTNDADALADRILFCLDKPEMMKKIGRNGRKSIAERFEMDTVFSEREKMMEDLLRTQRNHL